MGLTRIPRVKAYRAGVTIVTPTIPPRAGMLAEMLGGVGRQERPPDRHIIEWDLHHEGAAITRNRALAGVDTKWTAFLDDDDELYPQHLRRCLEHAGRTDADIVYPMWKVDGLFSDPLDMDGHPDFDAARLRTGNYIPLTALVRTDLLHAVGGFPTGDGIPKSEGGKGMPCEDWGLWLRLLDAGAHFVHLREITWRYNFHTFQYHGRVWHDPVNA